MPKFKENILYMKTVKHKPVLAILLVCSLILIFLLYFAETVRFDVWFGLNASNVNKLIENLSLGYVASYMFYYIVVVIKEKEDKRIILPLIADYTYVMLNNVVMFSVFFREWGGLDKVNYITSIHNRNLSIYPTKDEINKACAAINPDEAKREAEKFGRLVTIPHFFGLMLKFSLEIDFCLDVLLAKSNHIDLKLLKLVTSLKISRYHNEMMLYKNEPILAAKLNQTSLRTFERSFDEYYKIAIEIEKFAEKELKSYVEREALKMKQA